MRRTALIAVLALVCLTSPAFADLPPLAGWFPVPTYPYAVLAHSDGSVWIGTAGSVLRYTPEGTLLGTVAGFASAGLAEAPGGDVIVLDYWNRVAHRYSSSGSPIHSWPITPAQREGGRVVVDPDGNIYVLCFTAGFVTSAIVKYDAMGNQLAILPGLTGSDGLALSGGLLFCSEIYAGQVHAYTPALEPAGTFANPAIFGTGLACDAAGNLIQPDYYGHLAYLLGAGGATLGAFDPRGVGGYPSQWSPVAADESSDHTYFIADQYNWNIVLFRSAAVSAPTMSWGELKAAYR
ncbi:MAG: hypothetical protein IPM94_09290 [bacterium]|nr:hypothetical protein [bacterium]